MNKLTIREITDGAVWDQFVKSQAPNTFLQSWEWGVVQEHTGESVIRLGIFSGGTQVGAAQVIVVHARRGAFLLIPHGPLVVPKYFAAALKLLVTYCSSIAPDNKAVALRVAPLLETSQATLGTFQDLGFRPAPLHIHAELTWVLDISPDSDQILSGMRKTTRHAIKKAEKSGVQVDILTTEEGLDRFWPLYETTKDRHGFVPFTKDALRAEYTAFARSNNVFIPIAHVDGKDVAGAIFIQYANTVFYHHGASLKLSSNVPAAQYLHWQAMAEAKRRGATLYNFWGIAPDGVPNHPFAGITTFKKGFGGYAIDYLHAHDLPLTAGYWKLWAVDRWRKWRRGF
jgi:lipid II:glycine glycyltransferase (peptidoglycan interpeptide bridge formation enzyme)